MNVLNMKSQKNAHEFFLIVRKFDDRCYNMNEEEVIILIILVCRVLFKDFFFFCIWIDSKNVRTSNNEHLL